jgi:hypothetical protein
MTDVRKFERPESALVANVDRVGSFENAWTP